jgi:phenylacetate-CoA ligase
MGIDFRARDFFHPLNLWRFHRSLQRSQWFDPSELAEHQDRLVRRIVHHAYENVPYYREVFDQRGLDPGDIRCAGDLAVLPRLHKGIVRREYRRLRATNAHRYGEWAAQTSGTTGEPTRFLLDRCANILEFAHYWRWFGWSGYRLGSWFAELSAGHFLGSPARIHRPFEFQRHCGRLLLNCIELSLVRTAQFAAAIRRYRPHYLKGMPSAVGRFAALLQGLGVDDLRFRSIFCTGEMLLPATRRLIGDTFRSPVFDGYGHMERTVAICECPAGSLHVNPEYGVLEIVDETTAADGSTRKGLAVGTGLHCFAMPLIRYETGDVIEYEAAPSRCGCGRGLPRILRVDGRWNDAIVTPDGRRITALFLAIDQAVGIRRGQIVQDRPDHLLVRVSPAPDWSHEREQDLVRSLREFVGNQMRITVECELEESMRPAPGKKWRTVVSQLTAAATQEI